VPENADAERVRTAFLEREEFRVLRFWNHEMLKNFNGVMETIYRAISG
jgi:very-short-patch-repair endonuclease